MTFVNVLAVVPVSDFPASVSWYERLIGRPADLTPMPGEEVAEYHLTASGGFQLVGDRERAGRGQLTLSVTGLDDYLAQLSGRGIETGPVTDGKLSTGERLRVVTVSDPDGNSLAIAQTG